MAKSKSTNNNKPSPTRGKNGGSKVAKKVGKKIRKMSLTKEIIIIVVVLVLVAALALGTFYLVAPAKFKDIFSALFGGGKVPGTLEGDILEVRFLDVGQGDSILIRFPDGKNMMIDAGGTSSKDDVKGQEVVLKALADLKITTLDYLMATHSDADHVDYLDAVLGAVQVNNVYRPAFLSKSENVSSTIHTVETITYDNFIKAAASEPNCKVIENVGEMSIAGDGYKMTIYAPELDMYSKSRLGANVDAHELNAVSPLCILEYSGRKVVFTGDGESKTGGNGMEEYLLNLYNIKNIDCDVLKVGHHGSKPSSGDALLKAFDFEYAVISTNGVKHGHPTPELIKRLEDYRDYIPDGDANGIQRIYRTDKDGTAVVKMAANGGLQWLAA